MEKEGQAPFARDQLRRNPGVDLKVVREAQRQIKELEDLGIESKPIGRIIHPFEAQPSTQPLQRSTGRPASQ